MTSSFDLWNWFEQAIADSSVVAQTEVVMFDQDGFTPIVSFVLDGCLR